MSRKHQVAVGTRNIFRIIRGVRQQDNKIIGRKPERRRFTVLCQIKRIAHACYQYPGTLPVQRIYLVFQQMHPKMVPLSHNIIIAGLIIIVAQYSIGAPR